MMNLYLVLPCVLASFINNSEGRKNTVLDLIRGKKTSRTDVLYTFRNYYKYNYYMTLEEMDTRILLLQLLYPKKIAIEIIGQSVEQRDIYLIIVTDGALEAKFQTLGGIFGANATTGNATVTTRRKKPVIFVEAALHAREWVAPTAAFYMIDKLLESPHLTGLMEWRIVPMANPDGYEYSHNRKRYWRKNRGSTSSNRCVGVDLNRNFNFLWQRTNALPCSEVYGGKNPFSEPETRALRDAVSHIASRAEAYVSLHAFGQLILYPDGITRDSSYKLVKMARGIADRLDLYHYSQYRVVQTFVPGASSEWAFSNMKIPYSFTFELQPHPNRLLGSSGFQLSEWKLRNAANECWTAIQYLSEEILLEKRARHGLEIIEQNPDLLTETTTEDESNLFEWEDVLKQVNRFRSEISEDYINGKFCSTKENLYLCPLMVFSISELEENFGN